jgi:hypothetical protein
MQKHITEIAFIPENWPQTERYGYHTERVGRNSGRGKQEITHKIIKRRTQHDTIQAEVVGIGSVICFLTYILYYNTGWLQECHF